jgi:hypothetical protein
MLYGVFGLPGSGKSYYVVKEFILERIVTGTVVSNIKLNDDVQLDGYIYLEKNDVDNLHNNIKRIIENTTLSHDDKKILLKNLLHLYCGGSGDLTLIIDEAHLYGYRGRSSNIAWADDWISIHRHVLGDDKLDLVLVTQVPSRLNTEIAGQVEVAVQAIPSSQRINKSLLEYSVFGSVSALKSNDKDLRMKRLVIRGSKKIFDVYQSGFVQSGSGDFRKKIFLLVAGIVAVASYTVYSFSHITDFGSPKKVSMSVAQSDIEKKNVDIAFEDVNASKYYKIICISMPPSFDYKKVKDFMYVIRGSDYNQVCYRRYEF